MNKNITKSLFGRLNTTLLVLLLPMLFAVGKLSAQEVSNDPSSENYSPADFVKIQSPEDFNVDPNAPKMQILKKGGSVNQTTAINNWIGLGDGTSWNDGANWSDGVPTSDDDVTIPGSATVQLIDGANATCSTLTIENGGALTIGALTLTVADDIDINLGGSLSNSGTIYVGGDWVNSGSFFSNSNSNVRFNGLSAQSVDPSTFYNLYFQGSNNTVTAQGDIKVENYLSISVGVSFDPGSHTISIAGNFENDGTLVQGTGTFNFNGTGWQSIYSDYGYEAPGTWNFNNIDVTGNAGGIAIYDTLNVNGDINLESSEYLYLLHRGNGPGSSSDSSDGYIQANGGALNVAANSYILVGSYIQDGFPKGFNTITFATEDNSSLCYYRAYKEINQIVRTHEDDGGQITYGRLRLEVNGSQSYTSTKRLDGDLDVDQYIYIDAEAGLDVTSSNYDINVWGNWQNNADPFLVYAGFNPRNATVTFDGASQYIQGTASTTFNNLVFSGTSNKTLQQDVEVRQQCTVSSGVTYLNLQGYTLDRTGSLSTNKLTIEGYAILYVRGANNFPDFRDYSFSSTSTVRYDLNSNQTIKTGINYGNLYLGNGGTKTLDGSSFNLTVEGNFQLGNSTTLSLWNGATPFTFNLQGDYLNQGTMITTSSTIQLTGTKDQSFNTGGDGSGRELNNLTINKSAGTATLNNNLLLTGDFSLQNGDFGMEAYNRNITVQGDWATSSGTEFLHGTGTVYFTGTSPQTIDAQGDGDFWNVDFSGTGQKSLLSDADVNNYLTIQSGSSFDLNSGDLYVGGTFNNNNGGSFDADNQTLVLDGSTNANFYIGPNDSLWNLTVNKSGGAYVNYDEHDLSIGGNVILESGEFRRGYNSSTSEYTDMIVYGNWTNNGGKMQATTNDTVYFAGADQTISGSGTDDFDYLIFTGSGTKTISGNVDANRNVVIESGVTLSVDDYITLKVGRDFINNGTYVANLSTLAFEEYAGWGSVYITTGGDPLYNLEVNLYNTGYELYLQDDLDVNNNITITRGALDVTNGSDYSINCGGSWVIDTEGRFNERYGLVTFDGSASNKVIQSNGYNFYGLVLNSSGSHYTMSDDLATTEDLVIDGGALDLNGNFLNLGNGAGDSLVVNDSIIVDDNAELRMANGSQIVVNNLAFLIVSGSEANLAKVTNQGSGSYAFDVLNGGTIAAGYYTFEYMDSDGVNIQSGATIDPTLNLSNGIFTNGVSGGTLLTVSNTQTISITGVSFPSNPGGGAYNVTKTSALGTLTFVDASGSFQGSAYENDPNGLVLWTYSNALFTWVGTTSTNWDVASNWDINSVPGSGNRVLIPAAPSNQPIISSTVDSCFHITIESSASLTFSTAKLVVTGDVNVEGTLSMPSISDTLKVQGNWANSGSFNSGSGEGVVVFYGSNEQNINPGGTGTGKIFNRFVINKEGGSASLGGALAVNRQVSLINGTFDVNNYDITVAGSWLKADTATFNYQTRTVTFTQQDSMIYGSGANDFYNLVIDANVDLGGSIDVNGSLTINTGYDLDVSSESYGITLERNWVNNGSFTARSGNMILDGATQYIQGTAATIFNNLNVESTVTYLNTNATINGNFTLSTGRFELNTNTLTGSASGLFVLSAGTQLYVENNNFPSTFGGFSLDQTSYVRYRSSGNEDVYGQDANGGQISFGYLYLEVGGTKTAQHNLDVNGSLYIANGVTFDLNSQDMNVEIYWYNNQGGTFTNTGDAGTVTFDRDGTQYIYPNAGGDGFPNLVFAGTGAKVLNGDISVTGNLTLNTGVNYLNLNTYTVTGIGGPNEFNLSSNVTLYIRNNSNYPTGFEVFNLAHNSIVRYDGNLAQNVLTHDADGDQIEYGDIYFDNGAKTLLGNLDARGRFYIYGDASLDATANRYNVAIGGNYENNGSITNVSMVTFDGGDEQIVYSRGTAVGKRFNHLRINKSSDSYIRFYTNDVRIDSNVVFDGGTLANHGRTISVYGNWTATGSATMEYRAGNVTFVGDKQIITTGGASDFYDLNINSTDTTFLGSNIQVLQDLNIGGILDVTTNNYTIEIQDDFTNTGTFIARNGLIEFNGTTTQEINTGGNDANTQALHHLKVNKTNGYTYLRNTLLLSGNAYFEGPGTTSIRFYFDDNDVEVQGSWYNPNAIYAVSGDETVSFTGTTKDTIQSGYTDAVPNRFNNLVINHQDSIIHVDDIRVDHGYTIEQGEVYLNGHNFYFGSTYNADENFSLTSSNGVAKFDVGVGGQLLVRGGNNVVIEGTATDTSVFRVSGQNLNISEVTYWGNRNYRFNVNGGGRIYAKHYRFSGMDTSGVRIDGGMIAGTGPDTTEDFSHGSFALGQNAGRYLYLVDNDQTMQIDSVSFINSLGASGANVDKVDADGGITFYNANGEYAGDTYERDPNNKITWISEFSGNAWNGFVSSDWHTSGNWVAGHVPLSTEQVTIPNTSRDPLITSDAECASISIENGAILQIGSNADLTINGGLQINSGGTVNVYGNDTISFSGDYVNAGTLNAGQGTFTLNGTIQKLNTGGTANTRSFYNFFVTDGTVVMLENTLRVTNNMEINSGSSVNVGANRAIYVEGDYTNSGTLVYGGGTVTFNGASDQVITGSGSEDFNNVIFSDAGTKTLAGSIDIQGYLRINSGTTVDGGNGTVELNGSFYNYGTFVGGNGTINMDGTGGTGIYADVVPTFHNLIFSNGGSRTLYTDINVDSLLIIESGVATFNLQTYAVDGTGTNDSLYLGSGSRIYVRGSDNFPSNFTAVSLDADSYVRYDADMTQTVRTIDADAETFEYGYLELYHTSVGSRKVLNGDLVTQNQLQINDLDTLDVTSSNFDITCGGRFNQYGYILANGSAVANTLTMNGQGNYYFTPAGSGLGKELYDVVVDMGDGNTMTFVGTEELICNNFTINSGRVNPNGNRDITIGQNFIINTGEFLPSGSHLYFVGSGNLSLDANGSTLNLITLDGTGKTLSLDGTMSMNNNLVIGLGDTLTLNGNTLNFGNGSDAITVNGVLEVDAGAKLQMANTSSMLVNSGGELSVVGESGNIAQVTRQSGTYSIEVNGKVSAQYYLFEYMNQQGLYINNGTIDPINNFSNGIFTNGTTNGKFLNLSNVDQVLTGTNKIVEIQFPTNPGGTSYNIYRTGSTSLDSIVIEDATGSFEGSVYEYDPNNAVYWTYTSVTRNWTGTSNSNWHNANNWSPKAVPSYNDNVIITSKANLPIIQYDSAKCKNLEIQSGSLTLKSGHVLDVVNNITINSGATFSVGSSADTIRLSGNWTNSGTFTNGGSLMIFNGSNSQNIISGGAVTGKGFYKLQIDKNATSNLNISGNDILIENDLELVSGTFDIGSRNITINGDWKNQGGTFICGTGKVTFGGAQTDTLQSNGDSFYDLTINALTGSIRALDDIRVENDMVINSGSFIVNGNTLSIGSASGDKLSIQGTLVLDESSTVQIKGGSDGLQVESGGVLQAIGTSTSNLAELTRYGTSGSYPVIINSGGQISAQYAKFSYTNGYGVSVSNGATINTTNKLHNCVFENGSQSSFLRIANNQVLGTITGVIFSSTGTVPSRNVYYDGTGSVLFNNYKGGLAGARYEYDNGSDPVGNVRWTFSETQSISGAGTYTFGNDLEITVNSLGSPALSQISVELLDELYNSISQTYNRYYVISTNAGASGYNANMKLYYADGSNGSSNEVPESGSDVNPKVWYDNGFVLTNYDGDGNNTSQNWAQVSSASNIEGNWFISEVSDETALPVELASYGLENLDGGVSVNWSTATETDNLGFILERSTKPDSGFAQVASYLSSPSLKGQGTVSVETNYEYVDYANLMAGETYYYRLSDVDISGTRHVLETKSITRPEAYTLYQNYPNPFNPTTTIQFSLQKSGKTVLAVYDILGRKVATLLNREMKSGAHVINWNARNYASGVYFYRLQSGSFTQVKKMMLIK